jgi:DNA-directed RNA polymerase subunit RPC12/RpoP
MISFKCKNCGGEMSVDSSGSLICEYCGSKEFFKDVDLTQYKEFRSQMLNYLRGVHDAKADGKEREEMLWGHAEEKVLKSAEGDDITIRYLYTYEEDAATVYLTRNNAIFVYSSSEANIAYKALAAIERLSFPPADVKGLSDCFPKLNGKYELAGGGVMLAFGRSDNLFPLPMFGSLAPEHTAWVISRLENICCVLEYSDLVHGGISEDSVWINPFNHHAVLMGHWHTVLSKSASNSGKDLTDIRKTALRILGMHKNEAPKELIDFLEGKPEADAFFDFEKWDKVIETGFGGRRFAKMDVNF